MEYSHLKPYKRPSNYMGETWEGWYPVVGQSRDSDALERSNYRTILADLQKLDKPNEDGDSTVTDTRCSHWAVGWVETVYVHESNLEACQRADEILGKLEDYPVFDEEDWSRLEDEDCRQCWESMDCQERAEYLRRHIGRIYPERRQSDYSRLRAAVKGDWYAASNLLPCPSDLIS